MRKMIVLSFVLLALLALSVTPALAQQADEPAESPVPAASLPCPGAPTPQLVVNGVARVAQTYSTLWVSPTSSAFYKRMLSANQDVMTVLDGPFCAGGPYNWYQVQHTDPVLGTLTGWVTEGTGNAYWVVPGDYPQPPVTPVPPVATPVPPVATPVPPTPQLPPGPDANANACPGAPPFRLAVNGQGTPADVFQTLWVNPYSTAIHTTMLASRGDVYRVVSGPYCYRNYNWWEVTFNGITGFITEGTGNAYWAEPVGAVQLPEPVEPAQDADAAMDEPAMDEPADAGAAAPADPPAPEATEEPAAGQ